MHLPYAFIHVYYTHIRKENQPEYGRFSSTITLFIKFFQSIHPVLPPTATVRQRYILWFCFISDTVSGIDAADHKCNGTYNNHDQNHKHIRFQKSKCNSCKQRVNSTDTCHADKSPDSKMMFQMFFHMFVANCFYHQPDAKNHKNHHGYNLSQQLFVRHRPVMAEQGGQKCPRYNVISCASATIPQITVRFFYLFLQPVIPDIPLLRKYPEIPLLLSAGFPSVHPFSSDHQNYLLFSLSALIASCL